MARAHLDGVGGVGGEQGLVGQYVDPPHKAARAAGEPPYRPPREQPHALITTGPQAGGEVFGHLLRREGREVKAVGDALLELADAGSGQRLVQLGLPEHHDLEELLVLGLEVAQEPDLFQGLDGHALGLLDEGHDAHVLGVPPDQIILKGVQDLEPAVRCRGRQFQLEGDGVQDVLG